MAERIAIFALLFALTATHPVAAHAYLPVIIGLVSAVGGAAAVAITAVLGGVYFLYRYLRGKKSDETDENIADSSPE